MQGNKTFKGECTMDKWMNIVESMSKKRREENNKLIPSKMQIKYLEDYSKLILTKINNISFTSALAHEGVINFEEAQEIIDWQRKQIEEDICFLQGYLYPEKLKEEL